MLHTPAGLHIGCWMQYDFGSPFHLLLYSVRPGPKVLGEILLSFQALDPEHLHTPSLEWTLILLPLEALDPEHLHTPSLEWTLTVRAMKDGTMPA